MDPAVLSILRCPRCKSTGFIEVRAPRCERCGTPVPRSEAGVLGLLNQVDEASATSTEQRFMHSQLVARIYDRTWRPAFVRLFAGRGASAELGGVGGEMFIHKHSLAIEERDGPWLDLSCGPGAFTRALGAAAPGALVVGLDISQAMLEVAAERTQAYSNVVLVQGDAHALPFAEASFGGVNNAGALHVYDDPEQVFREVWRVLRPGGIYVGSTFAEAPSLLGKVAARAAGIRRFAPTALRSWLQRLGFSDYEDLRVGGAIIFRARRP
ncbi:MAG: methyltransferase domain-containing protein [Kofleriaceae bacterium]